VNPLVCANGGETKQVVSPFWRFAEIFFVSRSVCKQLSKLRREVVKSWGDVFAVIATKGVEFVF
jgi:hypothetical protein